MSNGILRGVLAALFLVCSAAMPPSAEAIDPSYSGSWYNPPESGSGFNLEVFSDDHALLFWYTYDEAGDPVWLYSEGAIDGETIDFTVYYADGMHFSDLDTADKVNRVWGTLTMQFQSCNAATITYASTLNGIEHSPQGTRTHPVQRLVNIASLPCRSPVEGYWAGFHRDPTLNPPNGAFAELSGVLAPDGRVFFSSIGSDEVFIGTYAVVGDLLQFAYEICPNNDGACFPASGTASFASKDFVRGTSTSQAWGIQPFLLTYRTVYDRAVSLASIAGNYTLSIDDGSASAVTISATGALSGSNNEGCVFTGQLVQPNANFNLFYYDGTVSGCGSDVWSGVVVNTDNVLGDRKRLEFRVENNAGAQSFNLQRP